MMKPNRATCWTQEEIVAKKRQVKASLSSFPSKRERLAFILNAISESEKTGGKETKLEAYVLVMSALVHHERHGGLTARQIIGIVELGRGILRLHGVDPETSRVSHVWGDLYSVHAQICLRAGRHWEAAWQLELASRYAGDETRDRRGKVKLAFARQALRQGHAYLAKKQLDELDSSQYADPTRERARLHSTILTRLQGDYDTASELAKKALSNSELDQRMRAEYRWEEVCIVASRDSNLLPMLNSVRRGGEHFEANYILEAALWCLSMREKRWLEQMPGIASLQRNKMLRPGQSTALYKFVETILACYDSDIPMPIRLEKLGEQLSDIAQMSTIELEALCWLAAGKWLFRIKSENLASLVLGEYQSASMRLTEGSCSDCLNLAEGISQFQKAG